MRPDYIESLVRQFPVGQGGLMVGDLSCRDAAGVKRLFRYGFDCGSVNREHFEQGLGMCSAGPLDLLFISHLDADHVNGIDVLAAEMQVEAIVLPCLDALQVVTIACEAMSEGGTVKASVASFLRSPERWFAERGIKRVYYVQRSNGNDPTPPYQPGTSDNLGPDRRAIIQDNRERLSYTVRHNGMSLAGGRVEAPLQVEVLGDDTSFHMLGAGSGATGKAASWVLVPYVHPFDERTVAMFRRAAAAVLRVSDDRDLAAPRFTRHLLSVLSDETRRKELKACYSILTHDNNRPSMSLYSGPDRGSEVSVRTTHGFHGFPGRGPGHSPGAAPPGAWLSTGDANLGGGQTLRAWLRRYERLLQSVDVFVLPHHGSHRNLHDDVIRLMPGARMLACAASRRDHHPHPMLRGRLRQFGHDIVQVSEDAGSAFSLEVTLGLA